MAFDLVIRNGTVVDGSGSPGLVADVGVVGDRIAQIGRIDDSGGSEIDADGLVVSPGFIDGHTHLDAQIFWDPLGTNSCWHGVTSVIMGNCGFTLAPSRPGAHKLVIDNLERAEDISPEAIAAGVPWTWETFPEYLDAIEATPKGINYATQIGHCALRTAVMGERAFGGAASDDDLDEMDRLLREALDVGAIGFTTTVSDLHVTPDGRPVASVSASWDEITRLVHGVAQFGAGVFQIAPDLHQIESPDQTVAEEYCRTLEELAVTTKVPLMYAVRRVHVDTQLAMFDRVLARGGVMFGQTRCNSAGALFSFRTHMPFDHLDVWKDVRSRPIDEQAKLLRDPETRARLVSVTDDEISVNPGRYKQKPLEDYEVLRGKPPYERVGDIAKMRRTSAVDVMVDLSLDAELGQMFCFVTSEADEQRMLTSMSHPQSVMTLSDAGAHVQMVSGGDLQTHLLGHWVRERQAFSIEEGVKMITSIPARAWGLQDRGLVREGMFADLNVFDPAVIAPDVPAIEADLPAGAQRVTQKALGIRATIVSGKEVISNGQHTGEYPGKLIRGSLPNAGRYG